MNVSLITTTTRPEGVAWWNEVEPELSAKYGEFVRDHPAVLDRITTHLDENSIQTQIVLPDAAALGQFLLELHATPFYIARQLYNKENAIVQLPSYSFTS